MLTTDHFEGKETQQLLRYIKERMREATNEQLLTILEMIDKNREPDFGFPDWK